MSRGILPAILFAHFFFCPAVPGQSKEVNKSAKVLRPSSKTAAIELIRPVVVQIGYRARSSQNPILSHGIAGTGFIVSKAGYVVTNLHVINNTAALLRSQGATEVSFTANFAMPNQDLPNLKMIQSFVSVGADVVDSDQVNDVALLKLQRNPFAGEVSTNPIQVPPGSPQPRPMEFGVARCSTESPAEGEEVLISGYPLSQNALVTQRGIVASQTFRSAIQPMSFMSAIKEEPNNPDLFYVDAVTNPGNSGGPVYLPGDSAVVGISEGNLLSPIHWQDGQEVALPRGNQIVEVEQNSGLTIVVPIRYTIALLKKNNIPYSK